LAAVDDVLDEIGAGDRPRLLALNKIDLLGEDRSGAGQPTPSRTADRSGAGQPTPSRTAERRRALSFRFPDAVQVSGATGEGVDDLRDAIEARFLATLRPMELLVPYADGGSLSELHDLAGELEREDTPEGVRIRARVPAAAARRFERFERNGDSPG